MKKYTLTAAGTDFEFNVTIGAYNRLINQSTKNPSGSTIQFLESTVIESQKKELSAFLNENPAAPQDMGNVLVGAFAPRVEVTLKK